MANLRELRRRIRSVKNMAQATKAMEMVSASKMRKAQTQALSGRSYNDLMRDILQPLRGSITDLVHPLLQSNDSEKNLVVLVSSNRGLTGALNTNIFRPIAISPSAGTDYIAVGKKSAQFLARAGQPLLAVFELPEKVTFQFAKTLKKLVLDLFLKGEFANIHFRYANFINTLRQQPAEKLLLPISRIEIEALADSPGTGSDREFVLEPDPVALLNSFLPHYLDMEIYQILLENAASEHSARMVTMKNATDNAQDLVGDLTLTYNGERQTAITAEILDISTAAATLT